MIRAGFLHSYIQNDIMAKNMRKKYEKKCIDAWKHARADKQFSFDKSSPSEKFYVI